MTNITLTVTAKQAQALAKSGTLTKAQIGKLGVAAKLSHTDAIIAMRSDKEVLDYFKSIPSDELDKNVIDIIICERPHLWKHLPKDMITADNLEVILDDSRRYSKDFGKLKALDEKVLYQVCKDTMDFGYFALWTEKNWQDFKILSAKKLASFLKHVDWDCNTPRDMAALQSRIR